MECRMKEFIKIVLMISLTPVYFAPNVFAQDRPKFLHSPPNFENGNPWPKIEMPVYKQFRLFNHPSFGWQVCKLGDVNGDGDFAVTAHADATCFTIFGS